jgi:hypothetical protein
VHQSLVDVIRVAGLYFEISSALSLVRTHEPFEIESNCLHEGMELILGEFSAIFGSFALVG